MGLQPRLAHPRGARLRAAAPDQAIAVLGGLTLLLTGIEFPKLYWNMLDMQHAPLAVLVTRNVMLVATFGFAAWRLWRLAETLPD